MWARATSTPRNIEWILRDVLLTDEWKGSLDSFGLGGLRHKLDTDVAGGLVYKFIHDFAKSSMPPGMRITVDQVALRPLRPRLPTPARAHTNTHTRAHTRA